MLVAQTVQDSAGGVRHLLLCLASVALFETLLQDIVSGILRKSGLRCGLSLALLLRLRREARSG